MLLRVHANESRHQAGQRVGHTRHEQLIHDPDVVFSMPEGEIQHAKSGYAAHYRGYDQQWDVFDAPYDEPGGLVAQRVGVLAFARHGLLEAGKRSGEDEEARQQEPDKYTGENVVQ